MTDTSQAKTSPPASLLDIPVNILTTPNETFRELQQQPSKLFPLLAILLSTASVMFWYFSIVGLKWYVDETLYIGSQLLPGGLIGLAIGYDLRILPAANVANLDPIDSLRYE